MRPLVLRFSLLSIAAGYAATHESVPSPLCLLLVVRARWAMPFDIFLSSCVAKKREITGDVLSKVHPIPKGRVLKTICCSNIPKFVPKNIEIKNLF